MRNKKTQKTAILSILVALAIIFSILENFLPQPLPGVKLGLANLVGVIVLLRFGVKDLWLVSILRVVLTNLLLGGLLSYGFVFAISGTVAACSIATLLYYSKNASVYSISAYMAIFHIIAQIIMVSIMYGTWGMLFYLPISLTFAYPAGLVIAMVARQVDERVVF